MKPVIVFVLAFVVAAAGGTGAKVMMTKPAAKAASDSSKSDSTKADATKDESAKPALDSTRTDTAIVASGEQAKSPADSGHLAAPAAPAAPAPVVAQAGKPVAMPVGLPMAKQQVATPTTAPTNPSVARAPAVPDTVERRLAKVFTSMDAKQAAKVLEHMSDGDVEIILGYVGVKQAAAIMGALPPERVATLSKLAMKGGSE
jgi:hypothetical protein